MSFAREHERALGLVVATLLVAGVVCVAVGEWKLGGGALILAVALPGYLSLEKRADGRTGREAREQFRARVGYWFYVLMPIVFVAFVLLVLGVGVRYIIGTFDSFFLGLRGRPPRNTDSEAGLGKIGHAD